jgi:hypothetical protein
MARRTLEFTKVGGGTFHPPLEGKLSKARRKRTCDGCNALIPKGEDYLNVHGNGRSPERNLRSPSGGACPSAGYYCINCIEFN